MRMRVRVRVRAGVGARGSVSLLIDLALSVGGMPVHGLGVLSFTVG